ncbi:MAG: hypothetical protein M1812_003141 [Candelaria pacifica]|nr:MAG: hypothetical protein M1812_003141 [Candelaria pacifica]
MATHLLPESANKARVKDAAHKEQLAAREAARKHGVMAPHYEFLELIGKGTFGRVYRSKDLQTGLIVAIKIVNIDRSDYQGDPTQKDEAIKDLVNEIKVLQQLKSTKAKNVNLIDEAFSFSSQLWIVSDYCSGGSLYTLMKASTTPGFEEKYIIPIARELAEALKSVHEAGIIHRDVKAANILISEDGHLQLCDFGVSGILENKVDKRSTIIGTPFWMPPEMHKQGTSQLGYGQEVDVWAYGCTIFEITTGLPPNARIRPERLGTILTKAPRLEGGSYSSTLREFVAYCLEERPDDRPSMESIQKQPYIFNTAKKNPTRSLKELVEKYARWEKSGGQRASLFQPGGAAAADTPDQPEDDVWNFSTTADFDLNLDRPGNSPLDSPVSLSRDQSRKPSTSSVLSQEDKAKNEQRVLRGGLAMGALFDENAAPYEYQIKDQMCQQMSDLRLRNDTERSSIRDTQIDLGEYDSEGGYSSIPNLDLANVPTIKASRNAQRFMADTESDEDNAEEQYSYDIDNTDRRATKDWKMPLATDGYDRRVTQDWKFPPMVPGGHAGGSALQAGFSGPSSGLRPRLLHTATAPVGAGFGNTHLETISAPESPTRSIIDLDLADDVDGVPRPSTASSFNGSVSTDVTNGDPFDLEHTLDKGKGRLDERFDSVDSFKDFDSENTKRYSGHRVSKSEPTNFDTTFADSDFEETLGLPSGSRSRSRQNSLSSDGFELPRRIYTEAEKKLAMEQWHRHLDETFDMPILNGPEEHFDIPVPTGGFWDDYDPAKNYYPPIPFEGDQSIRLGDPDFPLANASLPNGLLSMPTNAYGIHGERTTATNYSAMDGHPDLMPGGRFYIPMPEPPSAESMMEGADEEVVAAELERALRNFGNGLNICHELLQSLGGPSRTQNDELEQQPE